ncbi:MAG: NAD-binding protein [Pseudonocardiaceae bacterium]
MPIFLSRLISRLVFLRSWATPVVVTFFVFATAWPLMAVTEGVHSPIVDPANFWWWFVITASTVGYGDFYPESGGGHVVGAYVVVGGIVTLTTIFTKLATVLEEVKGRRMQGSITVDDSGHTVLLGYAPGRTERIADELLADGKRRVVLCTWDDVSTHPMADRDVQFVRGELTDVDVLTRAGVHRAGTVLVDVRDDNEALAVAVTVDHASSRAHVVVTLRDMARAPHLRYVDEGIRCVQWHTPRMVTEELTSPGITEVYAELMTHGGANTYSATLPESLGPVTYGACQTALGQRHGVTVLAARVGAELVVNPDWQTELPPGTVLYYVSAQHLDAEQIARSLRSHA